MTALDSPPDLRRLPLVLEPAEGESIHSWLTRWAANTECPPGVLATHLGLPRREGWTAGVRVICYGIVVSKAHCAKAATAAGLEPDAVEAMHLQRFDRTALDLTCLDWTDERTVPAAARSQWFIPYSSRACPACLRDRPGVWPVWWRLGHAACCPVHRLLLVDACPDCGIPLTRGYRGHARGLSVSRVPDITRCGNHTPHGPCERILSTIPTRRVDESIAEFQTILLTAAQRRHGLPDGEDQLVALAGEMVEPAVWFAALHDITAVAMATLSAPLPKSRADGDSTGLEELQAALDAIGSRLPQLGALGARYRGGPPTAGCALAAMRLSAGAMSSSTRNGFIDALLPLREAAERACWLRGHDPLRGQPPTGVVRAALAAAPRRSGRVVSALRSATHTEVLSSDLSARARIAAVPQLLPLELYERLASLLPGTAPLTGRRFGSLASARMLGASSWKDSADLLELVTPAQAVQVSDVVTRRIASPPAFWDGVAGCVDTLVASGVDYRERERTHAALHEIPEGPWQALCRRHGVMATRPRARHAAAWVWETVAGGHPYESPAFNAVRSTSITHASVVDGYRRFIHTTPPQLLADLTSWSALMPGAGQVGPLNSPVQNPRSGGQVPS